MERKAEAHALLDSPFAGGRFCAARCVVHSCCLGESARAGWRVSRTVGGARMDGAIAAAWRRGSGGAIRIPGGAGRRGANRISQGRWRSAANRTPRLTVMNPPTSRIMSRSPRCFMSLRTDARPAFTSLRSSSRLRMARQGSGYVAFERFVVWLALSELRGRGDIALAAPARLDRGSIGHGAERWILVRRVDASYRQAADFNGSFAYVDGDVAITDRLGSIPGLSVARRFIAVLLGSLAAKQCGPKINVQAVAAPLPAGYCLGNDTLLDGISELPAATIHRNGVEETYALRLHPQPQEWF